jgi:hypothetical protein
MLASSPASILNQNSPDLGIPYRFNPDESDSSVVCDCKNRPVFAVLQGKAARADGITGIRAKGLA